MSNRVQDGGKILPQRPSACRPSVCVCVCVGSHGRRSCPCEEDERSLRGTIKALEHVVTCCSCVCWEHWNNLKEDLAKPTARKGDGCELELSNESVEHSESMERARDGPDNHQASCSIAGISYDLF